MRQINLLKFSVVPFFQAEQFSSTTVAEDFLPDLMIKSKIQQRNFLHNLFLRRLDGRLDGRVFNVNCYWELPSGRKQVDAKNFRAI